MNFIFYFQICPLPDMRKASTKKISGKNYFVINLNEITGCNIFSKKYKLFKMMVPIIPILDGSPSLAACLWERKDPASFITSFSNLKFNETGDLVIKNTSSVEKKTEKENELPASRLTFKVIRQEKVFFRTAEGGTSEKYYKHKIKLNPLDLGIEGVRKIREIVFTFVTPPPGAIAIEKGLEETWLYKNKMLDESVGKTFSLNIKRWRIGEDIDGSNLVFFNEKDFDLDSFHEEHIVASNGNRKLVIGTVIIFAVLALIAGFFYRRRRKKFLLTVS
jgi:hypothetical protein